jgi:hypothetical protein
MKKSRTDIDRAIARLRREEQIPLTDLEGEEILFPNGSIVRPIAPQILRWGTQGASGVFLDVLLCRKRLCWVTSRPAVDRFLAAIAERDRARLGV